MKESIQSQGIKLRISHKIKWLWILLSQNQDKTPTDNAAQSSQITLGQRTSALVYYVKSKVVFRDNQDFVLVKVTIEEKFAWRKQNESIPNVVLSSFIK